MSRNRYLLIGRFLGFDDRQTRPERVRRDKMAAMREV